MKPEDIFNAITDIRDSHIDPPQKRSPRRRYAAALSLAAALVLMVGLFQVSLPQLRVLNVSRYQLAGPVYPSQEEEESLRPLAGESGPYMEQGPEDDRASTGSLPPPCSDGDASPGPVEDASPEAVFARFTTYFLAGSAGKNRLFSPLDLTMSLSMLAEITAGGSREQVLSLLGAEDLESLRAQAEDMFRAAYINQEFSACILANSLWLSDSLDYRQETVEGLADRYYASSFRGGMGSSGYNSALRDWVNQQTGGHLAPQVESMGTSAGSLLDLISTIYYHDAWRAEFSKDRTTEGVFHAPGPDGGLTDQLACQFMNSLENTYWWGSTFTACSKSLEASEMLFLLPGEGVSVDEMLATPDTAAFLQSRFSGGDDWENSKEAQVYLSLPKFDVSSDLDLTEGLAGLGLDSVFIPGGADFSPLLEAGAGSGVCIDKFHQPTRVKVDEEGVTAVAVTEICTGDGAGSKDEVYMTLDRPFVFVITRENLPVCVGVVNRPV